MPVEEIMLKRCCTCKKEKDKAFFGKNRSRLDGLHPRCRECRRIKNVEHSAVHRANLVEVVSKVCSICGEEKSAIEFTQDFQKSDGLRSSCNVCERRKNKERYSVKKRVERPEHGEKCCFACKTKKDVSEFYADSKMSKDGLIHICKQCTSQRSRRRYKANPGKHKDRVKKYASSEQGRQLINSRFRDRRRNDIQFCLSAALRSRMTKYISGARRGGSISKDLGCTFEELQIYLERLFYPHPNTGSQMSWDNYGGMGWELDHWIPLSSFDLTNPAQYKKAAHWSNLRPLWESTNKRKWYTHPEELPTDLRAEIPDHFWDTQSLSEAACR